MQLLIILLFLFHQTVESILHGILCPRVRQGFAHVRPLPALGFNQLQQLQILLVSPWAPSNFRVQVIYPSFSALLAGAVDVGSDPRIQLLGNFAPFVLLVVMRKFFNDLHELIVFILHPGFLLKVLLGQGKPFELALVWLSSDHNFGHIIPDIVANISAVYRFPGAHHDDNPYQQIGFVVVPVLLFNFLRILPG